ncbi:hypothetical protein BSNK01_28390 [Bacillaceae bacterium]
MVTRILIAGVDRHANVLLDSFRIEQILTQAVDSLQFQTKDYRPFEGQEIRVEDDDAGVLFAGIIDSVKLVQDNNLSVQIYEVTAQDYTYQLDRRLVVETYENMAADEIVRDIITKYGDNFTTNHVQTGAPVVEYISFDYKRPSECFKELADYVGWDWFVDYDRDIWFFDPKIQNDPAPIAINETAEVSEFEHYIETTGLRNRVYVRGGTMLSDVFVHEIEADGVARTWILPHKPHELKVYFGGVPKTVGIESVHEELAFDTMMNFQEKYVRCSPQTATPVKGTRLRFEYKYDVDVITMVEDIASQQDIAAVQGGDGVYEHVIVDDSLTTIDAAEAAGYADLREHANPRVSGSFKSTVHGWRPGQLVTVDLPSRNIKNTFIVQKVTIEPHPDGNGRWKYHVEYGGRLIGIESHLKALVSAQQKKRLNDTALLHKFSYGADIASVSDEIEVTLRTGPWYVEESVEFEVLPFYLYDDFASFDSTKWTLNGDAAWVSGAIRLTRAVNSLSGDLIYSEDVPPDDFVCEFDYKAGGGNGADEILLVFGADDPRYSAITNGYRISIDEYQNPEDPSADNVHIDVITNGIVTRAAAVSLPFNVDDGTWRRVRIEVRAGRVKVYINGALYLDHSMNINTTYRRFGLSARTGGLNNEHWVDNVAIWYKRPTTEILTVGSYLNVWQPGSEELGQPEYQTSVDGGQTWSEWQLIDLAKNGLIELPHPCLVRFKTNERVKVRNWKKPFEETDAVCGFVEVS